MRPDAIYTKNNIKAGLRPCDLRTILTMVQASTVSPLNCLASFILPLYILLSPLTSSYYIMRSIYNSDIWIHLGAYILLGHLPRFFKEKSLYPTNWVENNQAAQMYPWYIKHHKSIISNHWNEGKNHYKSTKLQYVHLEKILNNHTC